MPLPLLRSLLHPPPKPSWLHWSIRLGRVLVLWYALTILFTFLVADPLTYPIPPASYQTLPNQIVFQAKDETRLIGSWFPPPGPDAPSILFFHGNGEDLGHLQPFLQHLHQLGFGVFAFDYRGYGQSAGRPSERGLYRDAEAAYRLVTGPLGLDPSRLFLFGRSLGSGPACFLAARYPIAGLILDGAFTSTFRVVLPFPPLPNDQFPNLRRLPHITAPLLLIHGTRDEVIPFSHSQKLAQNARSPVETFWVNDAGHNNLVAKVGDLYWERIAQFIHRNTPAPTHDSSPSL